jgi:hypothetical protein
MNAALTIQWFAIDAQALDEIQLVRRWLSSERPITAESRKLVANMLQRVLENARSIPGLCTDHIDEDEHDRPTVKYKISEKIALDHEHSLIDRAWEETRTAAS